MFGYIVVYVYATEHMGLCIDATKHIWIYHSGVVGNYTLYFIIAM